MPRAAFAAHRYDAVLFDLDGVLTSTTALHIACWREALDGVLADWTARTGREQPPFDLEHDYLALSTASPATTARATSCAPAASTLPRRRSPADECRARLEPQAGARGPGARRATASRRSPAPSAGSSSCAPPACAPPSSPPARTATPSCAPPASSGLFELTVHGGDIRRSGCAASRPPTASSRPRGRLGVPPGRARSSSRTRSRAWRRAARGGFGLVVGVARGASAADLRAAGADIVVADLAELVA